MNMKTLLFLLPILCGGCSTETERIADYHWGKYTVNVFKQHEPGYFTGWTEKWWRTHTVKYGPWTKLDFEWITYGMNLSVYPQSYHSQLLYLDQSKSLIQYYTDSQDENFVIASIDTGRDTLNFTPIFGMSGFFSEKKANPMVMQGARLSASKIFWGLPDDSRRNFRNYISGSTYFRPWMISVDDNLIVDHRTGRAYPRNVYIQRYRRNQAMLPVRSAWQTEDQPHPATPEIRALAKSAAAKKVDFKEFVWLGITDDRAAVWYADFSADGKNAQVCLENLRNDGWQCVVLETPSAPANFGDFLQRKDTEHYSMLTEIPFIVPGFSTSYGVIDEASLGTTETKIRAWLAHSIQAVPEADGWKLQVAAGVKVLDSAVVRHSNITAGVTAAN
ncbi:MAG TPA: hypothetical protein DCW29_01665 [Janthinobacterium sp.]|nr:hypothetical protein [Janthinobacterium sp.]